MTELIHVFVADGHEVVRRSLTNLLRSESGIDVVGEAGSIAQARPRIAVAEPDVALLDIRLPDGDGIELARDVRSRNPGVRCMILTATDDDEAVYAAVLAGASGYLPKDMRSTALVGAVRAAARGQVLLDPAISRIALDRLAATLASGSPVDALDKRILELIAEGLTDRQMAERLAVAEKTVRDHVSGLIGKLRLRSGVAAGPAQPFT